MMRSKSLLITLILLAVSSGQYMTENETYVPYKLIAIKTNEPATFAPITKGLDVGNYTRCKEGTSEVESWCGVFWSGSPGSVWEILEFRNGEIQPIIIKHVIHVEGSVPPPGPDPIPPDPNPNPPTPIPPGPDPVDPSEGLSEYAKEIFGIAVALKQPEVAKRIAGAYESVNSQIAAIPQNFKSLQDVKNAITEALRAAKIPITWKTLGSKIDNSFNKHAQTVERAVFMNSEVAAAMNAASKVSVKAEVSRW